MGHAAGQLVVLTLSQTNQALYDPQQVQRHRDDREALNSATAALAIATKHTTRS